MDVIQAGAAMVIGQKLLGKTFDIISEDIAKLYEKGKNKIIDRATKKIKDENDGKTANLRVTRDVFWNGSFTDESICAEYFGGILASSRSDDGKDDNAIHYVNIIKSLSSKQLQLHYIIYNSLNKLFLDEGESVNIAQGSEFQQKTIWFSSIECISALKLNIDIDLNVLYNQGLIHEYKTGTYKLESSKLFPYMMIKPTTFGVLLYAIAHNKFEIWNQFSKNNFGDFEDISLPQNYHNSLDSLLMSVGIK